MHTPPFVASKIIGQLTNKQFHGLLMVSVLFYEMKQTSEVDSRNVEYVFCCFYSFSVESQSVVSLSEEGHSYVEKKNQNQR